MCKNHLSYTRILAVRSITGDWLAGWLAASAQACGTQEALRRREKIMVRVYCQPHLEEVDRTETAASTQSTSLSCAKESCRYVDPQYVCVCVCVIGKSIVRIDSKILLPTPRRRGASITTSRNKKKDHILREAKLGETVD